MPKTALGTSLLALDVVVPLISSKIRPCASKTFVKSLLYGLLKRVGSKSSPLSTCLLYSPTGSFAPLRFNGVISVVRSVLARPSGTIKFI